MPISRLDLEPDKFYHIYSHAVSRDNLFHMEDNYLFFISKIEKYLVDYVDIYAYCLMPNHFHLLFQVPNKYGDDDANKIVVHQISKVLNSYAQAINKQEKRMGSLFSGRFKRKYIDSEDYLKTIIRYIHKNPVNDNFVDNVTDWEYSSYNEIVQGNETLVKSKEVIELFNDRENFIYSHEN